MFLTVIELHYFGLFVECQIATAIFRSATNLVKKIRKRKLEEMQFLPF